MTLLGVIPPLNGIATVERVAANAVMAGCLPDYFPLVLAAVQGVLQPGFNLDGVQTTTGNVAPLVIINGPCRNTLQINYSSNVLGQGWRANSTIGRASTARAEQYRWRGARRLRQSHSGSTGQIYVLHR